MSVASPAAAPGSSARPRRQHGPVTRAAVALIRTYQLARSGRVSPCRFTPTCSEYGLQAIEMHGLRTGLNLTVRRLLRCRPGGPFGADPVPENPHQHA